MTTFYFTGTGNSLAVAKRIGGTLVSIPQMLDADNLHCKDDAIGVVFPIYYWAAPKMVRRFLDRAKLEADYIFAIGTYGSLPGAAMRNLQRQALKNGYRFDYANHLLMLDNFLPVFDMDRQIKKLPKKKVGEQMAKIVDDINNRRHMKAKAWPGSWVLSAVFGATISTEKYPEKYIVNERCDKCGICAKVCPAKNIAVTDKVSFADSCEACLSCLHNCPRNAMHHTKEKNDKRWRNPEVSLKEIIDANNRGDKQNSRPAGIQF